MVIGIAELLKELKLKEGAIPASDLEILMTPHPSKLEPMLETLDYFVELTSSKTDGPVGDKNRERLTTSPTMSLIVQAILTYNTPKVQSKGCHVIDRFCYNNAVTRKRWVEAGAARAVAHTFKRHGTNPKINIEQIFWAFWHMGLESEGRKQFVQLGLKELLRPGTPTRERVDTYLDSCTWNKKARTVYDPISLMRREKIKERADPCVSIVFITHHHIITSSHHHIIT